MSEEIKINGEYTSRYSGNEIDQIITIIKQNWDFFLKIPEFKMTLDEIEKSIAYLYDNKLVEIDNTLKSVILNNNGTYILQPNEINMKENQIIFANKGGRIEDAFENSLLRIENGHNYVPIYASKINGVLFSMGINCGSKPEMHWYYGTNKIASISYDGSFWCATGNDLAEFRISDEFEAGRVICENGDGTLSRSKKRLQPGANIVSDTFGFVIGEKEESKIPVAIAGRVLAYPYEDQKSFTPGQPVCAGPNGTVSKMSRREVRKYPERIIGTVSELPNYNEWGKNNLKVNGRIWIKIK